MSEPFDPYSQWLGIEPHELPADHYRLLGIQRFESDPALIAAAADERMMHVRSFQMGPRASYTQKLLNELAAARVCLLNPGAKAGYDQLLEGILSTHAAPPRSAQIASPPIEDNEELNEDLEEPGLTKWVVVATISIVLLASAAAVLVLLRRNTDRITVEANSQPVPLIRDVLPRVPEIEESEPILIYQEGDGSVNLDASFAQLHGPTLRLGRSGNVNVITDWESMDDWASWKFKAVKLPPQGIFHVDVTYAARPESDGGTFVIAVGEQQKECDIRGSGEVVTDEYFLAVPSSGDHVLTVRAKSKPAQRLMTLKSVKFVFP